MNRYFILNFQKFIHAKKKGRNFGGESIIIGTDGESKQASQVCICLHLKATYCALHMLLSIADCSMLIFVAITAWARTTGVICATQSQVCNLTDVQVNSR